ncbi:hypothetical protein HNY73_005865 [Argiope bruennichi]|uniref:Uncharacterized protein n=1 Tax=Argiope bruennichi TaxID=94029 RepID=A0A8T0FIV0_ARGBR|nr:hypothetical protein HNY73_005865 [Argiope bruennichi]
MNELEDKFNLPTVDFKKYDRLLNAFEDYQHVMWNAYDWGYFGIEHVNELQAIAYKLDCKLCEGEMNEKLLEMFDDNIKIVKTLEPLKHNIDWDLVDEEPIPYFMFDEWRKNRNCEKEAERIQLYKEFVNRNKKYVMRLESDATKIREDMSKLNFSIDDAHSFSIFELNTGEANVEYTIYQQIVMDYINHLVNLYENFENKQNASVFEELSLFQINIEKYENQLLANALLEFIGQLPTEAYDALSADFKRAIVNLQEAHTEECDIGVNRDLRDCERELTNVKKKYFVYYFSDDQQKYKYIHY